MEPGRSENGGATVPVLQIQASARRRSAKGRCAVSRGAADSYSTSRWRRRLSASKRGKRNWIMRRLACNWLSGAGVPKPFGWPMHPSAHCGSLRNLERAYARYHAGRTGVPTFRKRGRSDGFRYAGVRQLKLDQQTAECSCRSCAGCDTTQ